MRMPFSDEMALRVAQGEKTETRRLVTKKVLERFAVAAAAHGIDLTGYDLATELRHNWGYYIGAHGRGPDKESSQWQRALWKLPRYKPGDVCAVAEALLHRKYGGLGKEGEPGEITVTYRRDGEARYFMVAAEDGGAKMRTAQTKVLPARYMPVWAARDWVKVLEVGVERLQEIRHNEKALRAEGIVMPASELFPRINTSDKLGLIFERLWDSLHAKGGHGWEKNDLVWVYKFERCEKPKEDASDG